MLSRAHRLGDAPGPGDQHRQALPALADGRRWSACWSSPTRSTSPPTSRRWPRRSSCWSAGRSRSTCSRSARVCIAHADLLLVRAHGARPQVADARAVRLRRRRARRLGAVGAGDRRIDAAVGVRCPPARRARSTRRWSSPCSARRSAPISSSGRRRRRSRTAGAGRKRQRLRRHPAYVRKHLRRIKLDTIVGMGFSNLVALCIVVATAVTLNQRGIVNIQTSAQAAEALRPVAGEFAFARLRARHHRHRPARRAGARRLGRLRGERAVRLEGGPVARLPRGARLLPHHHRRHRHRLGDGLLRRSTR